MSLIHTLQTIFEIALFIAVVWCIFNEGKLIALERRIATYLRRKRLHIVHGTKPTGKSIIY